MKVAVNLVKCLYEASTCFKESTVKITTCIYFERIMNLLLQANNLKNKRK